MMMRRALAATTVAFLLLVIAVAPAGAKMPPFELDAETQDETVIITVRLVEFGNSSTPPDGFDTADLNGLLAVYPHDDVDTQGRPVSHENAQPVDLRRIDTGVYQGRVVLDSHGLWSVGPFAKVADYNPDDPSNAGYPETVTFEIPVTLSLDTFIEGFESTDVVAVFLQDGWVPLLLLGVPAVVYLGLVSGVTLLVRHRLQGDVKPFLIAVAASIGAFVVVITVYLTGALYFQGLPSEWSNESYDTFAFWARIGVGVVYTLGLGLAGGLGYRLMRSRQRTAVATGVVAAFLLITFPVVDFLSQCMIGTGLGMSFGSC